MFRIIRLNCFGETRGMEYMYMWHMNSEKICLRHAQNEKKIWREKLNEDERKIINIADKNQGKTLPTSVHLDDL